MRRLVQQAGNSSTLHVACDRIRIAGNGHPLRGLSATFNMAHPDRQRRELGVRRLRVVAQAAAGLGVPLLTLCSGTQDREDMWREHPDNRSRQAWTDLLETMEKALAVAADSGVDLAIEPEGANVVYGADQARALFDTLQAGPIAPGNPGSGQSPRGAGRLNEGV